MQKLQIEKIRQDLQHLTAHEQALVKQKVASKAAYQKQINDEGKRLAESLAKTHAEDLQSKLAAQKTQLDESHDKDLKAKLSERDIAHAQDLKTQLDKLNETHAQDLERRAAQVQAPLKEFGEETQRLKDMRHIQAFNVDEENMPVEELWSLFLRTERDDTPALDRYKVIGVAIKVSLRRRVSRRTVNKLLHRDEPNEEIR